MGVLLKHLAAGIDRAVLTKSGRPVPRAMRIPGDSGGVDRILLALIEHAREAIVGPGVITIDTEILDRLPSPFGASRPPGPYLRLSVADTGSGSAGCIRSVQPADVDDSALDERFARIAGQAAELGACLQTERRGSGTRVSVYLPLAADSAAD